MARKGSGESSSGVSKEEFDRLMSSMNDIKEQMSTWRKELSDERQAADDRLVKKMRMDKGIQFKRKSNEKQHQFNETVLDKFEAVQKSLRSTPPAIEKAKEALGEGEQLIKNRQKLIRTADSSDYGWGTVAEYEEDELADGSDDEKRLYRAELRAGKKVKATRARKNRIQFPKKEWAWKSRWQPPQTSSSPAVLPQASSSGGIKPTNVSRPQHMLGPCFECGKLGHLKNTCPDALLKTFTAKQGK